MELKGTKTEQNLMTAFAGESQARNKYTYFASKARKEGFEQIAAIFEETAANEKEHAKLWFKELFKRSVITRNRRAIDYSAAEGADRMGMPADIRIKAVAFALDDDTSEKPFAVQGVEQPVNRC